MAESEFRRYQVPTHLKTDDQLTIGWFTFTFRQLTVLVLGGGAAYEVWTQFPHAALAPLLGETLTTGVQIGCVAVLVPLTLALAAGTHARSLVLCLAELPAPAPLLRLATAT